MAFCCWIKSQIEYLILQGTEETQRAWNGHARGHIWFLNRSNKNPQTHENVYQIARCIEKHAWGWDIWAVGLHGLSGPASLVTDKRWTCNSHHLQSVDNWCTLDLNLSDSAERELLSLFKMRKLKEGTEKKEFAHLIRDVVRIQTFLVPKTMIFLE